MFKNRNIIGNHRLTRTSNDIENHEKSSINLKKIDYNNKAKAKRLYGFNKLTGNCLGDRLEHSISVWLFPLGNNSKDFG